jgi:integrase
MNDSSSQSEPAGRRRSRAGAPRPPEIRDPWVRKFLTHLATDRGASVYTQRNYRQALTEFAHWHLDERQAAPAWEKLQRDDFRNYLRYLGRNHLSRAATQLRFSALRTFYKFLMRRGVLETLPIKNLALPKRERRLPKYLTRQQMIDLLDAPVKLLASAGTKKRSGPPHFQPPCACATWRCWRRFIPAACASANCAACGRRTLTGASGSFACAARAKRNGSCPLANRP